MSNTVPLLFNYQGVLQDRDGNRINGTHTLTFRIYDAPSDGTVLWPKEPSGVEVEVRNGLFSVLLGATNPISPTLFIQPNRYIGVTINNLEEMVPRQRFASVPYAVYAYSAHHVASLDSPDGQLQDTVRVDNNGDLHAARYRVDQGLSALYSGNGKHLQVGSRDSGSSVALQSGDVDNALHVAANGRVGIGTTSPNASLHIWGRNGWNTPADFEIGTDEYRLTMGVALQGNGTGNAIIRAHGGKERIILSAGDQPYVLSVNNNGRVGIGTNNPNAKLDVNGTARTSILQITGGSDIAEPFDLSDKESIEPGMVVSIDVEQPGKLTVSQTAYDKTVAGVISGAGGINPGLVMRQDGTVADGRYPVSLTGRVYVKTDARYGSIQPGDLLTTSDTPGHAMKVTDYQRAQGAILGKAMSHLDEGTGLVLVLVSLQ